VIAITGLISPTPVEPELIYRDLPVMLFLTISLFVMGTRIISISPGIISRKEGFIFVLIYVCYNGFLASTLL